MKGASVVKNTLTWLVVGVALAFFLLPVVWIVMRDRQSCSPTVLTRRPIR